jgi:RNA polymerase sigma-70 factor (ECF subfamily)
LKTAAILPKCGTGTKEEADACEIVGSLYRSWYIPVVRYARHKVRDYALAEDMVQDAFMALYSELRSGKAVHKPKAWLFLTVRRRIADHYRRASREEIRGQKEGSIEDVAAPDLPPGIENSGLSGLFGILSGREQEVLLLRISSLKYREIGDELGISSNSVSQLLSRAIRKLRTAAADSRVRGYVQRER